ncbi:hypothetical protein H311_00943 [Anncaliia algerae PRA109]|nr:hypothetical protein H311_00943 [Anncaliia algerae PRA109]
MSKLGNNLFENFKKVVQKYEDLEQRHFTNYVDSVKYIQKELLKIDSNTIIELEKELLDVINSLREIYVNYLFDLRNFCFCYNSFGNEGGKFCIEWLSLAEEIKYYLLDASFT